MNSRRLILTPASAPLDIAQMPFAVQRDRIARVGKQLRNRSRCKSLFAVGRRTTTALILAPRKRSASKFPLKDLDLKWPPQRLAYSQPLCTDLAFQIWQGLES